MVEWLRALISFTCLTIRSSHRCVWCWWFEPHIRHVIPNSACRCAGWIFWGISRCFFCFFFFFFFFFFVKSADFIYVLNHSIFSPLCLVLVVRAPHQACDTKFCLQVCRMDFLGNLPLFFLFFFFFFFFFFFAT